MTYGCYNRQPFKPFHKAQEGYFSAGFERTDKLVAVPHKMTKDCQYTLSELGQSDEGCKGCKWKAEPAA